MTRASLSARVLRGAIWLLALAGFGGDPGGPACGFSLQVASAPTIQAGSSGSLIASASALGDFAGSIAVSVSGGPSGMRVNPEPSIAVAPGASATITLAIPRQAEPKTYELSIPPTRTSIST